jgi:regulation of enolase protein 1 (concanavalin A-like superfamily)
MTNPQALPLGLEWAIESASWQFDGKTAAIAAARRTDAFVDPAGAPAVLNAARALARAPSGRWQFSARVTVDLHATYDAGALLLWSDDRHFAKLCFEYSPQGDAIVVSVVTRDVSDDANAWTVDGDTVWLRISNVTDQAYAFHSSGDGRRWNLVRYFALAGSRPMQYGVGVQSPTGDGCAVRFDDLRLSEAPLADLRDGS